MGINKGGMFLFANCYGGRCAAGIHKAGGGCVGVMNEAAVCVCGGVRHLD